MGNRVYDYLVDFVARFAAAVLNHPVMNESVLDVVVKGVDKLMEQPNLDEHIMNAGHTVAKRRDVMAHKAGRDFPKVAGAFVKGMVHIGKPGNAGGDGDGKDMDSSDEEDDGGSLTSRRESDHSSQEPRMTLTKEDGVIKSRPHQHAKKKARWLHPMHMIRHTH